MILQEIESRQGTFEGMGWQTQRRLHDIGIAGVATPPETDPEDPKKLESSGLLNGVHEQQHGLSGRRRGAHSEWVSPARLWRREAAAEWVQRGKEGQGQHPAGTRVYSRYWVCRLATSRA